MKTLLIGTRSKEKFPEIAEILRGISFQLINLNDVAEIPKGYEAAETEETFEGNAILKARDYGKKSGILCTAEDAGLEIDALNGAPGVLSARWAPGSDTDRYTRVLEEMEGIPDTARAARFRAVVALYDPMTDKVQTCAGVCSGKILTTPRGSGGFGYDPIFYVPQFEKTFAELTIEEKNSISHRSLAWRRARQILEADF